VKGKDWAVLGAGILLLVVLLFTITPFGSDAYNTIMYVLNPSSDLALGTILVIAFILGILHGATPDEHTWPITFSYAIGSYSTRKGMKAGFAFSAGFTVQRAILTTLGFLGLAAIYKTYNLDGPVYFIVGIVMAVAGIYVLNKKLYPHLDIGKKLLGSEHHTEYAERVPMHEDEPSPRGVSMRMATVHGLIAGWGFGAYSTIITFILAPQVPGLIYAPLVGLMFGLGTMFMQIMFGALFANIARIKKLTENQIKHVGRMTAGRTLYYGGIAFAIIGLLIIFFPFIDNFAISTGNPIPNLSSVTIATFLVLIVVGIIGFGNLAIELRRILKYKSVKGT
jgi:ABC-type nickel/cobalt efflux system permease component RcnA